MSSGFNSYEFGNLSSEARNFESLGDMTEGISRAGMEAYMEYLKVDVLEQIFAELNDTNDMVNAINNGWQGKSRDIFLAKFSGARTRVAADLEQEFINLSNRLSELYQSYFEQDARMMEDII